MAAELQRLLRRLVPLVKNQVKQQMQSLIQDASELLYPLKQYVEDFLYLLFLIHLESNHSINEKKKQTYFERTGYYHSTKNPESIIKTEQTNKKKYGNVIPQRSVLIKNKIIESQKVKYGKLYFNTKSPSFTYFGKCSDNHNSNKFFIILLLIHQLVPKFHYFSK